MLPARFIGKLTVAGLLLAPFGGCGSGDFRGSGGYFRGGSSGTTTAGAAGSPSAAASGSDGEAGAADGGENASGNGGTSRGGAHPGSGGTSSGRGVAAASGMDGGGALGARGGAGGADDFGGASGFSGMSDSGRPSGGAGASGAGGAATAGHAGAGGASGTARTCEERCASNADCRVFSLDEGYTCNPATRRCERFAEPCRSSVECIPGASFWAFECASDVDCFFFTDDVCVNVGGVGRCARLAGRTDGGADVCDYPNSDAITLPRFAVPGDATVCGNTGRACAAGACVPACRSDVECTPARNGSVCDVGSGTCRCVADADCGGAGMSRCDPSTGGCECDSDRDCEEVPNADVCVAGRCGCSTTSACNEPRDFSGTSYVCE